MVNKWDIVNIVNIFPEIPFDLMSFASLFNPFTTRCLLNSEPLGSHSCPLSNPSTDH